MDEMQGQSEAGGGTSTFSLIVKIAFVILLVFVGIKFFSERNTKVSSDNGDVERKQKPKTQKEKI
jgi:energy-converting hydrogenase Eha subunit H